MQDVEVTEMRSRLARGADLLASRRFDEAATAYRQALFADPQCIDALRGMAYIAEQSGRLREAAGYLGQIVLLCPDDAKWRVAHGRALRDAGDLDAAHQQLKCALALAPQDIDAWIALGVLHRRRGDHAAALTCYEQVLKSDPSHANARLNVANVLGEMGRLDEAEARFRDFIARHPDVSMAHANLGKLLAKRAKLGLAAHHLREALRLEPTNIDAGLHLGQLQRRVGQLDEAAAVLRSAVHASPNDALAHLLLAETLNESGDATEANRHFERCLALDPTADRAMARLGLNHYLSLRLAEAEKLFRDALARNPLNEDAWIGLSNVLLQHGRTEEAESGFEPFIARPDCAEVTYQAWLGVGNYCAGVTAEEGMRRHLEYGRRFASLPRQDHSAHVADAKLRIGYVSGDLRDHSVAYFLEPVLARHDRERFQIHAYHTEVKADDVTRRLQGMVDRWTDCRLMADDALVQRIREDGIDILVDLSGHTQGNRLQVFARKAAPVQLSWLGYPTLTGVAAIDARISDWEVDPVESTDGGACAVLRLTDSYFCYRPPQDAPDVAPLPSAHGMRLCFGSFNNLAKITDATLVLWGQVLEAVPESDLLVKARALSDDGVRAALARRLAQHGIEAARVRLDGWSEGRGAHLSRYAEVDIALDTTPYNGATTTCEALWMGVPVITLRGETHAARMGASLLNAAGLARLVAEDKSAFVRIAAMLARDRDQLSALRRDMRSTLASSALTDEVGFTRALETLYRRAWAQRAGRS